MLKLLSLSSCNLFRPKNSISAQFVFFYHKFYCSAYLYHNNYYVNSFVKRRTLIKELYYTNSLLTKIICCSLKNILSEISIFYSQTLFNSLATLPINQQTYALHQSQPLSFLFDGSKSAIAPLSHFQQLHYLVKLMEIWEEFFEIILFGLLISYAII